MNKDILSPEIQKFIKDHENHDPFALMLKHKDIAGVPTKEIAQQIQSRQKAKKKLPEWYEAQGIYFPPPISLEQCSSQETAVYKSSLFSGKRVIDLTGGMGIDTFYLSQKFDETIYVEKDQELSKMAKHNFRVLGTGKIIVESGEAELYIDSAPIADLIYIDPSRRTQKKVFMMKDSQPDISLLLPRLFKKTKNVLVKLSPLMDISSAIDELVNVFQVHILAIGNEVKEVLFLLKKGFVGEPLRRAVNIQNNRQLIFEFNKSQELSARVSFNLPQKYLYEPNAAILKAGAFKLVSQSYRVHKLHKNSHLYTSAHLMTDFPGKIFTVQEVMKYDPKFILKSVDQGKANLVVRNFPLTVEKIRKETKIKEGGEDFLFFTTDMNERKVVIKAVMLIGR